MSQPTDTPSTPTNADNIKQTFRFISHYERLIDSGMDFDVTDRSAMLHEDGRAINLYMMLQDLKDALSGDLEWEDEE